MNKLKIYIKNIYVFDSKLKEPKSFSKSSFYYHVRYKIFV